MQMQANRNNHKKTKETTGLMTQSNTLFPTPNHRPETLSHTLQIPKQPNMSTLTLHQPTLDNPVIRR